MAEWYEEIFDSDYIRASRRLNEVSHEETDGIIELLSLRKNMKILDLCCGYGRHALELARRGYNVTGYDLSSYFLDEARKRAKEEGLSVEFVHGDIRELEYDEKFDVAVNLLTSFGFFSDEENMETLVRINNALIPNGRFMINARCFTGTISCTTPENPTFVTEEEEVTIIDRNSWDLEKNILQTRRTLFFNDGRKKEYSFAIRVYTLAEMIKMLEKAGMKLIDYYDNLKADPYTQKSMHYTIIAEKLP